MEMFPYKVEDVDGRPMISVTHLTQKMSFAPVQISAMILEHLKRCAESVL